MVACIADDAESLLAQTRAARAAGNTPLWLRSPLTLAARDRLAGERVVFADALDPAAVDAVLLDAAPARARRVHADLAAAEGRIVPVIAPDADGGYDPARLVVERTVTVNTAAAGGNAALLVAVRRSRVAAFAPPMRYFDAATIRAALPWPRMLDALAAMLREDVAAPLRAHHAIDVPGAPAATLLLMPAWRTGRRIGVKLVTVFPGNRERGERAVNAVYALFDASDGGRSRSSTATRSPRGARPARRRSPPVTSRGVTRGIS